MNTKLYQEFESLLDNSIEISDSHVKIKDEAKFRTLTHKLAELSALGSGAMQGYARFLTRAAGLELGVYPASINDYMPPEEKERSPLLFPFRQSTSEYYLLIVPELLSGLCKKWMVQR
jgi:hypothetical protein